MASRMTVTPKLTNGGVSVRRMGGVAARQRRTRIVIAETIRTIPVVCANRMIPSASSGRSETSSPFVGPAGTRSWRSLKSTQSGRRRRITTNAPQTTSFDASPSSRPSGYERMSQPKNAQPSSRKQKPRP